MKGALHLLKEGGEVELVPVVQSAGQLGSLARRQIEYASADGGENVETLAGGPRDRRSDAAVGQTKATAAI
jgi:hypothetical protein